MTFTKEWLQKAISQHEALRDEIPFGLDEDDSNTLAAMKLALASLELECGKIRRFDLDMSGCDSCGQDCGADMVEDLDGEYVLWDEVLPHLYRHDEYTAPPAPVSVPDGVLKSLLPDAEKPDFWFEHNGKIFFEGVKFNNAVFEACRAAMLQGAEPVTTGYKLPFEQWVSQRNEKIDVDCGCVTTEAFFHWLRIAYEAGNSPVVPDDWQLVPKQITLEMECALSRADSYEIGWRWALAAAPQQEVKP